MFSRILSGGLLAAVAGAAMLSMTSAPASAFTLAAPSLAPAVASADVAHVWYDHYHHWRGGPRFGIPLVVVRPGYGWHRHCFRGPMGHLHCN